MSNDFEVFEEWDELIERFNRQVQNAGDPGSFHERLLGLIRPQRVKHVHRDCNTDRTLPIRIQVIQPGRPKGPGDSVGSFVERAGKVCTVFPIPPRRKAGPRAAEPPDAEVIEGEYTILSDEPGPIDQCSYNEL